MQGCALAPCSGSLSLRLRVFPLASRASADSQAHSSIGTASGFNALRHLVSARFQDLFHSPPGVLFTFPSRYWFAIGSRTVFSLAGRSPRLRTGFLVSRPTPESAPPGPRFGYGALALSGAAFDPLPLPRPFPHAVQNPRSLWFGLLRFRSPLLTESISLSSPPGTSMFRFPGLPPHGYVFPVR